MLRTIDDMGVSQKGWGMGVSVHTTQVEAPLRERERPKDHE